MVTLELVEEERETLREMLDGLRSDLRMELAGTERAAYRAMLKARLDLLSRLMHALSD